ncbi:MAG: NUDIX domain-containing protein, partial [Lachnospiraceae bacterium]|nr:NUDIX domain-containing protein [Lachnospiraceae bacterium]
MRLLFEIDKKDYKEGGTIGVRPSVRGILVKDGRLAMIHSRKYDYYKFPGGGAEPGEDHRDTLIREVREESGLIVIPSSVREYGFVHRMQKGMLEDIFIQENYYYFCEAEDDASTQKLDDYEAEEMFCLAYVSPETAVQTNLTHSLGAKETDPIFSEMIER